MSGVRGGLDTAFLTWQVCGIELRNGLITRRFVTSPGFGTVDYLLNATASLGGLQSFFRTVKPEAQLGACRGSMMRVVP